MVSYNPVETEIVIIASTWDLCGSMVPSAAGYVRRVCTREETSKDEVIGDQGGLVCKE